MKLKWGGWILAVLVMASAAGCAQVGYYVQAAQGQFALMSAARPIDEWLARPDVEDDLKGRLAKVKEIREFAAEELGLPDNGSYTTYAELQRPYVMWNVIATPELSLKPKRWCFPVAGCVSYRGYYNQAQAQAYAGRLRKEGYDVAITGVPAYSTLGWFNDPVLSTFIRYPDAQLARLVFHELAHQQVYVAGDSQFNESFAVTVEEYGVERWLEKHGDEAVRKAYAEHRARKADFLALLARHRDALKVVYESQIGDDLKRRQKEAIFQAMLEDYQGLRQSWGGYAGYDRWFAEPLSNARLAAVATYHDLVPAFRALLVQEGELPRFYVSVRKLAALGKIERHQQLAALGGQPLLAENEAQEEGSAH